MSILQPNDDVIPNVMRSLGARQLRVAIANAERMAESTLGAGRKLCPTQYVEILPVNQVIQSIQLSYWPIIDPYTIVVEVRQSTTMVYGRHQGVSDWHLLKGYTQIVDEFGDPALDGSSNSTYETGDYILDEDGKLNFSRGLGDTGFNRLNLYQIDEARVTYTSGIDFSNPSYEAEQVKLAIASIMTAQNSDQYRTNVVSAAIEGEVSVQYGTSRGGSTGAGSGILSNPSGLALQEAMIFLKRYQPRGML